MYGHKSFLVLGAESPADIVSLTKGGYELANCNFSFEQGLDDKGKATTRVIAGAFFLTIPQFPPNQLVEWGLHSRNHQDGMIVLLDNENNPIEKIIFSNASCVGFSIDYTREGSAYACTRLAIQAEMIDFGNSIDIDNEWTK